MIQVQVKLKLTPRQERRLGHWLYHLTSVWNWAVKKIEHDAADNVYHTYFSLSAIVSRHGAKIHLPQKAIDGTVFTALNAWCRCFKRISGKPRLKGRRNRLNSIAFAQGTTIHNGRLTIPCLGRVRYHKQSLPAHRISQLRLIKRASGWYACLTMHAAPKTVEGVSSNLVGIDPGFSNLLTLSNGEKIEHPREMLVRSLRLAQSQRGSNKQLTARLQERTANQRKDRNHKLSRRLVAENQLIAFSADSHASIAKRFGKSVTDSAHHQLRRMLAYKSKCRTDGLGVYVEVPSKNSTRTCSTCGALTGPQGWAGLSVRQWECGVCGAHHDRDFNAAINTLIVGAGLAHEMPVRAA